MQVTDEQAKRMIEEDGVGNDGEAPGASDGVFGVGFSNAGTDSPTETIRPPILAIVQSMGKLSEKGFPKGAVVLGDEYQIAKAGDPLTVIILAYDLYYKQWISQEQFTAGETPQIFATAAEAVAAGFTTQWVNGVGPTVSPALKWAMLIEKPADLLCELFCIEMNGKMYAPARAYIDKTGYSAIADAFNMAAGYIAKARGIHTIVWEIKTKTRVSKMNKSHSSQVFNMRLLRHLTPEEEAALVAAVGLKLARGVTAGTVPKGLTAGSPQ